MTHLPLCPYTGGGFDFEFRSKVFDLLSKKKFENFEELRKKLNFQVDFWPKLNSFFRRFFFSEDFASLIYYLLRNQTPLPVVILVRFPPKEGPKRKGPQRLLFYMGKQKRSSCYLVSEKNKKKIHHMQNFYSQIC